MYASAESLDAGRLVDRQERLLRVLAFATLLVFFQAYMVAPLIPRLAAAFHVSVERIGLIVPAYLLAYGFATLFYGALADRVGRRAVMLSSFVFFVLLTALTALAQSSTQMIVLRLLTGLGASGIVPLSLALVADLFPYQRRGRPLGWIFGAMAGGMAIGSTLGVMLDPFVSWRGLFVGVAMLGLCALLATLPYRDLLGESTATAHQPFSAILGNYWSLLATARGRRTYAYVLVNAIVHGGVFAWLGVYFARRFGLGEIGIGLALLGYGIPGFLFGPLVGRLADRFGRSRLIPIGLLLAGASAVGLAADVSVWGAATLVTLLSLGYDLTQPLLAGIVTDLKAQRGQAMGLNVFVLFTGFGLGSLIFGLLLPFGMETTLEAFGLIASVASIAAFGLFRSETARAGP